MWTISHVHYQTQKHSKAMNRQSHEQSRKKVRSKHSSVLNMLFFLAFLSPHVASKWIERTKTKSKKKVQVHVHASNALTHSLFLGEKAKAKKNKWEKKWIRNKLIYVAERKKKVSRGHMMWLSVRNDETYYEQRTTTS